MAQSWHQTTSANVNYNEERGDYTESPVTTTKSPEELTWILLAVGYPDAGCVVLPADIAIWAGIGTSAVSDEGDGGLG